MSSLDVLNAQIKDFLKSETPEVLCIRGPWGVGKTHAWNEAYNNNFKTKAFPYYSYVSLFGIDTLDALKLAIFQSQGPVFITEDEPRTICDKIFGFSRKFTPFWQDLIRRCRFGDNLFLSYCFFSLSKTIICIDDLERRGKNLCVKDIMGLISQLKEQKEQKGQKQKNCKVVLILNDEELEGFKKEFNELKEKVIDVDINFEPSIEDIGKNAFGENYSQDYQEIIKTACRDLEIKNIRIIHKIKRLSEKFMEEFKGNEFDAKTMESPMRMLALAGLSEYGASSRKDVPTIDFLIEYDQKIYSIDQEKKNEPEYIWHTFLQKYGHPYADDLDKEIINAVQRGYFDEDALKTLLTAHNQAVVDNATKEDFYESWRIFHDSFNHNEHEVVENLYEACKRCMKAISIGDIDATICKLRPLEHDDKADDLITQCVTEPSFTHEFFNIDALHNFSRPRDEKFIKAIRKRYQELKPKKSLREALKTISEGKGWNPEDEEALNKATAEEYYNCFKTENGPHLGRWIEAALQCQWTAPDGITHVHNNIEKALQKIAGESKLNEMRIEKFNIPSSKGENP